MARSRSWRVALLLAPALCLPLACGDDGTDPLFPANGASAGSAGAPAFGPTPGGGNDPAASRERPADPPGGAPSRPASCQAATGAPTWSGCPTSFSKRAFERTVCSCGDLRADNTLTTTSGAEVAVNGDLVTSSPLRVAARLTVAGTYTATNTFDADEALLGGGLRLSSPGVVRGDASVGQILTATNSLNVGGTLHLEQPAEGNGPIVSGATVLGDLSVPAPCDCALPLDIPAVVQEASPQGTRPAAAFSLGDPSLPQDLDLPCGRVYLDEIVANNALTLHAVGRTVLFVRGGVRVSGPLRLDLAPGAELDVFVAGAFEPTNTVNLGTAGRPSDLRLYVEGPVTTSSPLHLDGHLLVPHASFTPHNTVDLVGSVRAAGIVISSPFHAHPDPSLATRDVCAGP